MTKTTQIKQYDLEERTFEFSKSVLSLCKDLLKNPINFKLADQVIRSSGSVGANYIETNEAVSKKDFYHRIKICRKETKETRYWLNLLIESNQDKASVILPLT